MIRLFFYPLWKITDMERRLRRLELHGWKLKSITLKCIFVFVKTEAKKVDYVVTFDRTKDNKRGAYRADWILSLNNSAEKIKTRFSGFDVFRVAAEDSEFYNFRKYRKTYIKTTLKQYTIISFVFFLISLFLLFAAAIIEASETGFLFAWIYIGVSLLCFLIMLYGYARQSGPR